MEATYDFLEALGLDETAQERDIRRAYARKLKQIDQELEPAAFQDLRGAYEVALDWARWKLAQEAQEAPIDAPVDAAAGTPAAQVPAPEEAAPPATAPQPQALADSLPQAEQLTPAQLGAEVYHRFLADAGALVALPQHGEVPAWRAAIEARFNDDELVNIDARIYFEACIASLLASGWHAGHEILFVAAQEAFGWAEDPRGLRQLGQAGRMLDQAIEERRLFEALQPAERTRMRALVKMLRQQELPATRRVRAAMPDMERMLGRFPAFMAVVAPMENVDRWRTVYRESGGAPIVSESEDMAIPPAPPERSFLARHGAWLFILIVITLAGFFNSNGGKQRTQRPASEPPFYYDSGAPAVPDAVLRAAIPPVFYNPEPGQDTSKLEAVFKVFLDAGNKVERVQNWQTSGNPAFDEAVSDALMAAKPFPADTPREFQVRFTGDNTRPGKAPKSARSRSAAPPPTIDMLRKHLPPVQYTPFPYAKPGEYKGTYQVELDTAGKVVDFRVKQSSGDARLDQAVEESARKAKPFPPGSGGFQFTYGTTIFLKKQLPKEAPREEAQESRPQDGSEPQAAEPEAGPG